MGEPEKANANGSSVSDIDKDDCLHVEYAHPTQQNRDEESSAFAYNNQAFQFRQIWRDSTSDNRLTLFGFRRFRTSHLLNLRFLEAEIDKIDHTLYQAGLQIEQDPQLDRLGLKHAKRDKQEVKVEDVVDQDLILKLRRLIKEYDEALAAFNTVMTMETFSLADNVDRSVARTDLHAYEKFKTRMLRVDLPLRRTSRDPIQHFLRKGLRRFYYFLSAPKLRTSDEENRPRAPTFNVLTNWERSYQNTARVAETVTRLIIALFAGGSLIGPLAILTYVQQQNIRLGIVVIFIALFCLVISLLSKASNYEAMAAAAAYAAVLSVFVSNNTP